MPHTVAGLNVADLHGTMTWRPLGPEALRQLARSLRPPMLQPQPEVRAVDRTHAYAPAPDPTGTRVVTPPPQPEPPTPEPPLASTQVEDVWVELIARVERARLSEAEASWSALESDGITAVWDPADDHGGPVDPVEERLACTRVEPSPVEDTARHHVAPRSVSPDELGQMIARPAQWPIDAAAAHALASEDDAPFDAPVRDPSVFDDTAVTDPPCAPPAPVPVPAPYTTAEMAPPRAALLLQLAPTGFAGSGTPIDAAVVPRGRLLDVGRDCAGPWANDPYLDPLHARLVTDAEGVRLIDPGSRGGVWLRLDGSCWLRDGDWFRVGEQFFAYDGGGGPCGSISLVDCERRFGEPIWLEDQTVIGRTGDVALVHDPFVSAFHCRTRRRDDGVLLEDLDSSNGTWVRLRSGDAIPFGSVVAIGRSLYRVDPAESF